MKSAICIEVFIQCFLERELSRDIHSQLNGYLHHFDCQDTDNDNQTECYFYFAPEIGNNLANGFVRELAAILGVPPESAKQENSEGYWRVEFVVELACIYPASAKYRFTLRQTTVRSEPVGGELVMVECKKYDDLVCAQRGLARVFADYVNNNCESLTYADIRQRRAVVRYGGGVTEVFELIEEGR